MERRSLQGGLATRSALRGGLAARTPSSSPRRASRWRSNAANAGSCSTASPRSCGRIRPICSPRRSAARQGEAREAAKVLADVTPRSRHPGRRRRVVDRAPPPRPQAARHRRAEARLRGRRAITPAKRRRCASRPSSTPAGSRCASSTNRRGRGRTSPRAAAIASTPISIARAAYWQGRAAEAAGAARRSDALLRASAASTPPPITASSPAPGSGIADLPVRRARDGRTAPAFEQRRPRRRRACCYEADARDLALPLYSDLAQAADRPARPRRAGRSPTSKGDARAC